MTAFLLISILQLDINTVAAGGGSRLFFRSGMFVVGPESAGANPGLPATGKVRKVWRRRRGRCVFCSSGGPLTVTDANLCLGRLYCPSKCCNITILVAMVPFSVQSQISSRENCDHAF